MGRGRRLLYLAETRLLRRRKLSLRPEHGFLMDRCWHQGQMGVHYMRNFTTGYGLRWLLRAMGRLGLKAVLFAPHFTDTDGAPQWQSFSIQFGPIEFPTGCSDRVNFAAPSNYPIVVWILLLHMANGWPRMEMLAKEFDSF